MRYEPKPLTADTPLAPFPAPNQVVAKPRRDILQTFGLDFRVAILTLLVDAMAFSGDIVSAGLLYPVEIGAAAVLGVTTYKIQKSWYGDDHDGALIKALVIALVTAIPVPIAPIVAGGAGVLGVARAVMGKR